MIVRKIGGGGGGWMEGWLVVGWLVEDDDTKII